jgi:hypothetical protein
MKGVVEKSDRSRSTDIHQNGGLYNHLLEIMPKNSDLLMGVLFAASGLLMLWKLLERMPGWRSCLRSDVTGPAPLTTGQNRWKRYLHRT